MVHLAMTAHLRDPEKVEAIKANRKSLPDWIAGYADKEALADRAPHEREWYEDIHEAGRAAGITFLGKRVVQDALRDTFFPGGRPRPHDFEASDGEWFRLAPFWKGKQGWFKTAPCPLARANGGAESD